MGWFRIGTNTLGIDVIGCKYVHPVTFIRGVFFVQVYIHLRLFMGIVFDQIYIQVRLFEGWFSNGQNTEC